jgi:hypothetical protein
VSCGLGPLAAESSGRKDRGTDAGWPAVGQCTATITGRHGFLPRPSRTSECGQSASESPTRRGLAAHVHLDDPRRVGNGARRA